MQNIFAALSKVKIRQSPLPSERVADKTLISVSRENYVYAGSQTKVIWLLIFSSHSDMCLMSIMFN